jgi:hypothetical protein
MHGLNKTTCSQRISFLLALRIGSVDCEITKRELIWDHGLKVYYKQKCVLDRSPKYKVK